MITQYTLRERELSVLEEHYKTESAEMIVIYGRRRLGKTVLTLRFLEGKRGVYLYTRRGRIEDILRDYIIAMREQLGIEVYGTPERFEEFLELLYRIALTEKTIVVIDEFQRLQEADQSSMSILQDYWDRKLRHTRIKLLLVGSLIGTVERLAIAGDTPLFGRPTVRLKIEPLHYREARKFWRSLDPVKRVILYGVFGGTPAYMDMYSFSRGFWENLLSIVIRKDSRLNNESEMLLASELRNPTIYMSILEKIASGKRGLPLGKIKIANYNVLPYINRLEKMDILERLYPLNEPKRGALYTFKDEFFRFWFRFLHKNRWLIEMERYDLVLDTIKRELSDYLGYTYERIFREFLVLYSGKSLGTVQLPVFRKFGPYWSGELEVDALGIGKKSIVVGEAKWQEKKIGAAEINHTIKKAEKLAELFNKEHYIVVILGKNGFSREINEKNVILLTHENMESYMDML